MAKKKKAPEFNASSIRRFFNLVDTGHKGYLTVDDLAQAANLIQEGEWATCAAVCKWFSAEPINWNPSISRSLPHDFLTPSPSHLSP